MAVFLRIWSEHYQTGGEGATQPVAFSAKNMKDAPAYLAVGAESARKIMRNPEPNDSMSIFMAFVVDFRGKMP